MPLSDDPAALTDFISRQVAQILSTRGGQAFTREQADTLDSLNAQVGALLQDASFGRINGTAQWLNGGVSVLNGSITAEKLTVIELEAITTNTGDLNVTGDFTAAASFPAVGARIRINSSGLYGFSGGATNTFKLNVDGSGEIGTGSNKITWTTGGVVTVPAATIGSLTIANVGGGVLGGTYQTATTGQHINISTGGIVVYNATSEISANETFRLNATTGAVTATGSFTVKSAATGAHITVDNAGGIAGYLGTTENATNRTFLINAVDGSGHLGLNNGTPAITWDSAGAVSIGGASLSSGKITASSLSVSTLSAISANVGTLTSGTINATSMTISNLSATSITTGTLVADRISGGSVGGSFSLGSADVTVNSTGKLKFGTSSADYLANNILHFDVSTTEVAAVEFRNGSSTYYSRISGWSSSSETAARMYSFNGSGSGLADVQTQNDSTDAATGVQIRTQKTGGTSGAFYNLFASGTHTWTVDNGATGMTLVRTNRALTLSGYLYPGTGSASQSSRYIFDASSNINVLTNTLYISGDSGSPGLRFANIANGGSATNWSSFSVANVPNTSAGYIKINIAGTNYRVAIYADA